MEVAVDSAAEVDASAYFEDPDGDALTYAATSSDLRVAGVAVSGGWVTVTGVAKGTVTIRVTATDTEGLSAVRSFRVTVPNRAPVAVGELEDMEVAVDSTAEVDASAYFEDPDGDVLVYAATSSDAGVAGVSVSGRWVTVTGAAKGTVTITVTATDTEALSAELAFRVTVSNRAPMAVGEVEDTEVAVGGAAEVDASDYFEDPDGDALAYSAVSSDAGVAAVAVSGSVVAVTGFVKGTATVTVTATDTEGLSALQSFQVTVQNQAPVAVASIADMGVAVDSTAEVDASDYFEDPDGDSLAYSATSSGAGVAGVSVSGSVVTVTAVAKGTVTVSVTATDPEGLSAEQSFQVTVPNRAPTAVGELGDLEVEVDSTAEVGVADHFEDPDGDSLTYTATSLPPARATVSVSGGTVTVRAVAKGSVKVTVTATDPEGLSAEQSFQVSVPNRAPMAVGKITDVEVEVDASAAVESADFFTDPDGDALAYSAASSDTGVAEVAVSGSVVTVTGVEKGTVTVTVTATDLEGLSAMQSFQVTVVNSDRATLGALYDALGGDDWTNNTKWKTDAPLGEWHGVTTNSDGRVVRLGLNDNNLAGQVPSEIGDLVRLEALHIFGNSLTGRIPSEIRNLPNLADLRLGGNSLSGQLPPGIGDLSELRHLRLQDNSLTGQLPPELGELSNLQTLYLNATSLEGSLPNELVGLPLNHFYWNNSELCAPGNSAFQSWLDSIGNHDGDDCPTFDLSLRFTSSVSSSVRSAVSDARDKWELALVETKLEDVDFDRYVTCFGLTAYVGTVDDHEFWVHVDSIDGEGGTLARAGYCYRRAADSTPLISASVIDAADVERMEELDALVPVVFHEMAHGLGFIRTHFDLLDLLDKDEGDDPDPHFEGELAIEAFDDAGGDGYQGEKVPVQRRIYSHWRESIFGDEIMTSSIDLESETPISAITLQAMADMGYEADLARADDYELPGVEYRRRGRTVLDLGNDVVHVPVMVVDADGRVVRVIPPPPGIRRQPPPWRDVRVEPEGRRR